MVKFSGSTIAQMTVPGLLMVFLLLTVLANFTPQIADYSTNMSDNLTSRGYVEEGALAKLIPMFIWVVVLSSIALYAAPQP